MKLLRKLINKILCVQIGLNLTHWFRFAFNINIFDGGVFYWDIFSIGLWLPLFNTHLRVQQDSHCDAPPFAPIWDFQFRLWKFRIRTEPWTVARHAGIDVIFEDGSGPPRYTFHRKIALNIFWGAKTLKSFKPHCDKFAAEEAVLDG